MRTKTKVILTAIIVVLAYGADSTWDLVKSPVKGAAAAAQLDDTVQSYAVNRALGQDFVEDSIALVGLVLLACVWWPSAKRNK
jgi:hypothetical protein